MRAGSRVMGYRVSWEATPLFAKLSFTDQDASRGILASSGKRSPHLPLTLHPQPPGPKQTVRLIQKPRPGQLDVL